ncbi:MAG TPA: RNA methyltransferase [Candidatus Binatia bacterium]|nr:RNA methyltransferase [Candidatus Binatia bacterium]
MASPIGSRAQRLTGVRALRSVKGRREQGRFAFEGATLLAEAYAAGVPIEELYVTQEAYDAVPLVRELDAAGTPTYVVGADAAARISDLSTPTGLVAVAPVRLLSPGDLMRRGSPLLVLAGVSDPANAGSLLRSADAFGCAGVLFGSAGVEPTHPKVVRASMGAVFRLALAVATPAETAAAAAAAGVRLLGLAANGSPLAQESWQAPVAIVVGNERHGLGPWEAACERTLAIPMSGPAESLSAAVAGSIMLYEAQRFATCQESQSGVKSQDYRP